MDHNTRLSRREREIAALVATGATNKEIARELAISIKTVKNILTNVFVKTQTRSRTELAIRLVRSEYAPRAPRQSSTIRPTQAHQPNALETRLGLAREMSPTFASPSVKQVG